MGESMVNFMYNCDDFHRTSKGLIEVINRSLDLSSRQRQFLLLIEKTDSLNQEICKRLSKSINLKQLIDLGLISTANKIHQNFVNTYVETADEVDTTAKLKNLDISLENFASLNNQMLANKEVKLNLGEFSQIKSIMTKSLKKTRGLVAADLIIEVEKAKTVSDLKKLTIRWRDDMLKSNHDVKHILAWFDDVTMRLDGV